MFTLKPQALSSPNELCYVLYWTGDSWVSVKSYSVSQSGNSFIDEEFNLGTDADNNYNFKIRFGLSFGAQNNGGSGNCSIDEVYLYGIPMNSSPTFLPTTT